MSENLPATTFKVLDYRVRSLLNHVSDFVTFDMDTFVRAFVPEDQATARELTCAALEAKAKKLTGRLDALCVRYAQITSTFDDDGHVIGLFGHVSEIGYALDIAKAPPCPPVVVSQVLGHLDEVRKLLDVYRTGTLAPAIDCVKAQLRAIGRHVAVGTPPSHRELARHEWSRSRGTDPIDDDE